MHPTSQEFVKQVEDELGFEVEVYEFPEGTKTAEDAAEALDCELGEIAKTIVMSADEELIIIIISGSKRVSEDKLSDFLGVDEENITTANPGEVKETLGWSIGGVPPFCHRNSVKVLLDKSLLEFDKVWTAAGTPKAVFPIEPDKLEKLAEAKVVDVSQ